MASLKLPQPAANITSATVLRWLKQPGEAFGAGDRLVELEAEDAIIAVEASATGVLIETLAAAGETVLVGADLGRVQAIDSSVVVPMNETLQVNDQAAAVRSEVVPILMPQAGNTMEEGTVVEWRVKEGDLIALGQILCEIETDKATMEYESPATGRLARLVAHVGEPVAVKELIAILSESDAAADAYLQRPDPSTTARATPLAPVAKSNAIPIIAGEPASADGASGRVKASPAARKMATERSIALETISAGSGPRGRILSQDVALLEPSKPTSGAASGVRRPMSKMRRTIGLNLQRSKQSIPHFYVRMTIRADELLEHYEQQKPRTDCSLNDLVVLAVGRAMRDFPAVRSQIDGDYIVEFPHANIGIAVAVDDGLVVPVVLNVDTLSLAELARETKRVVQASRKGILESVGRGNFTISNLGMFGVEVFSAIINPPESGILAVSAVRETVIVQDGAMSPGRVMTMTLSADHRVVDGLLAAKFISRLKHILEHPTEELS
jgi:pyruvate dehydrogenase E2 component (dihydrolipoyllysine-residue acetyltransferase)